MKLESSKAIETADKATKDATFAKQKSRALDIEASKKASEVKIDQVGSYNLCDALLCLLRVEKQSILLEWFYTKFIVYPTNSLF